MGKYLNPGNEGFTNAVNSSIYIDKTAMLQVTNKYLNTEQKWLCMSRPRRFGKSMTARMLVAYYSKGCDSEKLFASFAIATEEEEETHFKKHLNKENVISFDVTGFILAKNSEGAQIPIDKVVSAIDSTIAEELYQAYPQCFPNGRKPLAETLAEINSRTGEQFIFIIDEWDALFREAKGNVAVQTEYVNLLRSLFKEDLSVRFTKLAYITGIFPIKKYGTQSAMNNFDEYTIMRSGVLAPFVGFTEDEARSLCERFHMDMNEVRYWYDGYLVGGTQAGICHIYNPKSIVSCMLNGCLDSYWSATESYESLKGYILADFDGVKQSILEMIGGAKSRVNENSLACTITVAYYAAQNFYVQFRELPRGKGFADIVYLPKKGVNKPAMVVELKWDKDANSAIKQIKDKHYTKHLLDFSGELLLVGINYDKKNAGEYECEIEMMSKSTIYY